MNLFWKRIPTTAKFEQEMADSHELYHTFVKTEKSELLAEYKELADINFKQAKRQFKKKKEYTKSPLHEKELRFKELQQDSDIKNYLRYEKSNAFDFIKHFTQVHFEEFSGNKLDTKQWLNTYRWSPKQIKGCYSNPGEFQAYTKGENTEVIDGQLHIITKRKDAEGVVWTENKGFITSPFKYTSDLITGESFTNDKGCILIKFKLDGAQKPLQHFIRAYDDKNQRVTTIMESLSKRKFSVGRSLRDHQNADLYSKISGINLEKDFHILEMEWSTEIVSWRLNGHLIHQDSRIPKISNLHLAIGSRLTGKKESEGKIIIDYIRIFHKRNKAQAES